MSEPILLFEIDEFPDYFVGTDLNIYSGKYRDIRKLNPHISNKGYYRTGLSKDDKVYCIFLHRLIAKMFIPNPNNLEFIDHINNDRLDNRLENLRWVSRQDNNRNMSISKNNTSGIQGVGFDKRANRWKAHWCKEGKLTQKYFSIEKYGYDKAKQLAIEYRQNMVDELYNRPT